MKREFYRYFLNYIIENKDLYNDKEINVYKIIQKVNYFSTQYKSSLEGLIFNSFDEEYDYINNLINEINYNIKEYNNSKNPNSYIDEELQFYIDSYNKGLIISNDLIKNVYWESMYKNFNEIMKEKGYIYMVELFTFDFNILYKYKGFNYKIIEHIKETFKVWCSCNFKNNNSKNNQISYEKQENAIHDVINEFFI
ncbi:MAG: hypothetical protein JG776_395 [Caloramator sp.]|jgi:hypothetical protein|uniref:hypothetical protein n=1 Tax=Caloramator sp. TaxID=1871330 RepID=UPI001D63AF65|nr:hypothetical protein [Caloramator sp.]MBZ4662713.1 hypothetical protein [Caloramator sp.]